MAERHIIRRVRITRIARYTIPEQNREEVDAAIEEFLVAIRRNEPETEYRAFRESNGRGYVHMMSFPDQAGEQRHRSSPWTERFVEKLYPRCDVEPVFTDLEEIEFPEGN